MKAILILFFSVMLFGFTTENNSVKKDFLYEIDYSAGNNRPVYEGDYIKKTRDMITEKLYSETKYFFLGKGKKGEKFTELRDYDVKKGVKYVSIDRHYIYIFELNKPVTVDGKKYDMMYVRDYGMGTSTYYIK